MGQQNMVYTGPMIDNEVEHARLHPEPCVIPSGQVTSFSQRNELRPLPGNVHGPLPSGITPYNTFMAAPPATRVVPVAITPGLHNQLPFPRNQVMDGFNGAFKGKITQGFPANIQYFYPSPGSGSFVVPEYRGYDVVPVVMGPGRNQAVGAIGVDSGLQFMPLNHGAQPLQVVPAMWSDQQFCGNVPGIPYMLGYPNGYQVMTVARNPVAFVHPVVAPHPPMAPLQGSHNMDFHPQLASSSNMVPLQTGVELVPRFVGPMPPIGVRVYQPYHQELAVEPTSRRRGFPHLRVLPEDGVAMLDISNYGHRVDHHRDMRLDIDHMSYEELLALGEQIGNAGSGLSDGFILGHLKTRIFTSSQPEDASDDQELNFCTICQMEYNDQEKMGILDCSHAYHVECIKKWLVEKNTCPICKCTALATQGKGSGNLERS